jgi:hypothetical protein
MSDVHGMAYVCMTPDCSERLRGACDEPSFCSICLQDLTGVCLGRGVRLEDILRPYPSIAGGGGEKAQ